MKQLSRNRHLNNVLYVQQVQLSILCTTQLPEPLTQSPTITSYFAGTYGRFMIAVWKKELEVRSVNEIELKCVIAICMAWNFLG